MIFLVFTFLFFDEPRLHIAETELYQVMRTEEVFVRPGGELFVLNFDEARVQYYGADGKLKRLIGGRGKGPGEFTFPSYINLIGDHLYIFDELTNLVSVFDLSGQFVRHIRMPSLGVTMNRTLAGWFFFERNLDTMKGSSSILAWTGNDFKSQTELGKIETTGWGRGTSVESDGTKTQITYSPLAVEPKMITSRDGLRFYFADALGFHIDVYDGRSGKRLYVIKNDSARIPFDETWADEKYEESTKGTRRRNAGVKIKKLYPEFFPSIRAMFFDPEGNLVVDRWRGKPDDHHYLAAFNHKGKEIPVKYEWNVLRRLAGIAQGHAYIIMFEKDGDAGISRVPLERVNQFVKDFPVTDWSQHRSISISN